MPELSRNEPFAEYSTLLEERLDLQVAAQSAHEGEATALRQKIDAVDRATAQLRADPDLPQSALRCGARLAERLATEPQADPDMRQAYRYRLRQVSAFVLEQSMSRPELADDPRFTAIQTAMGCLAISDLPDGSAGEAADRKTLPVNYHMALRCLQDRLGALTPGEQYRLTAAQVITLAGPTMGFTRWQRHYFMRLASQVLGDEGFTFTYNNGRGRSARYVVGRPATS